MLLLLLDLFRLSWINIVMGSTGIDEEYESSVSMRGVVSSTSETNLRNHLNGIAHSNSEEYSFACAA